MPACSFGNAGGGRGFEDVEGKVALGLGSGLRSAAALISTLRFLDIFFARERPVITHFAIVNTDNGKNKTLVEQRRRDGSEVLISPAFTIQLTPNGA